MNQIFNEKYWTTHDGMIIKPKCFSTDKVINLIGAKCPFKVTLGGCIIKKVNETVILSKE